MYQELQRKVTEEKPNYSREEIQWLLEHLGDPSSEIRNELVFTSLRFCARNRRSTARCLGK